MYSDRLREQGIEYEHKATGYSLPSPVSSCLYVKKGTDEVLAVNFNFDFSDDYHYEIELENYMRWLKEAFNVTTLEDSVAHVNKLFADVSIYSFEGKFALENSFDAYGIKYDKIAFY